MLAHKYFRSVENDQIRICVSKRTQRNAADLCFSKQMHLHYANVGPVFWRSL